MALLTTTPELHCAQMSFASFGIGPKLIVTGDKKNRKYIKKNFANEDLKGRRFYL